jgi:hypothetical protein
MVTTIVVTNHYHPAALVVVFHPYTSKIVSGFFHPPFPLFYLSNA